jgi:hypothetical protein
VESQGRNIDGRKLDAQVYSYQTGGVFDAQVEFNQDLATIYFAGGGQLTIRLNQRTVADPDNILGYGRLGQIPLSRSFAIGLSSDNGLRGGLTIGAGRLDDLWRIRLKSFESVGDR